MTGDITVSAMGQEVLNALDMWIWWTNVIQGGLKVKGVKYQVILKWLDNFANTAAAQNMTEYLINSDGVNVMFGPYGSNMALPVIAICESKKMVLMASGASTTPMFVGTKYTYSTISPASTVMPNAVRTLISMGSKNIVTVIQNMLFTITAASALTSTIQNMKDPGITYQRLYISANPTQAEIDHLILNMTRLHFDVDLLVGCVYYVPCIQIINTAKRLKFTPGFMLFSKCLDNAAYIQDLNYDDRRYILGAVQWTDRFTTNDSLTGWTPSQFSRIYKSKYNTTVSYVGAAYFAGGLAITQALQNAGSNDSASLSVYLSRLQLNTLFGPIQFDVNGQLNSAFSYVQYDDQSNLQLVLPSSSQTAAMIHPMPAQPMSSAFYQECARVQGALSCQCHSRGCPTCTRENYSLRNVTSCMAEANVRYIPTYLNSECQGGFFMPELIPIRCDYVTTTSRLGTAVQFFAYTGAIICFLFLVWTCVYWKSKIVKASQPEFCVLTAFGGLVCSLSPVTTLGPVTTPKCRAHHCMFHLSFTLMMGCFFVRTFRVWRIFGNKAFAKYKFSAMHTFKLLSFIMVLVICILTIEFIIKPPHAVIVYSETPFAGPVPFNQCSTLSYNAFSYLLGFYEVLLILLACYFSFQNRNMPTVFSDSQYLLACVFEIAAIYTLGNLISVVDNGNSSVDVVANGVSASLYCIAAECTFFIPKVTAHWKKMDLITEGQETQSAAANNFVVVQCSTEPQTTVGRGATHGIDFRPTL